MGELKRKSHFSDFLFHFSYPCDNWKIYLTEGLYLINNNYNGVLNQNLLGSG